METRLSTPFYQFVVKKFRARAKVKKEDYSSSSSAINSQSTFAVSSVQRPLSKYGQSQSFAGHSRFSIILLLSVPFDLFTLHLYYSTILFSCQVFCGSSRKKFFLMKRLFEARSKLPKLAKARDSSHTQQPIQRTEHKLHYFAICNPIHDPFKHLSYLSFYYHYISCGAACQPLIFGARVSGGLPG